MTVPIFKSVHILSRGCGMRYLILSVPLSLLVSHFAQPLFFLINISLNIMYLVCICICYVFICKCNISKILALVVIRKKLMTVCMLPLGGRMRTLCNLRLQCLPDFSLECISHLILTLYWQGRFGAVSRRGIYHIWFRGWHISPSMPYREARSVAESSEGPTSSKSDRTGRNPGMTRLVRRSSAGVWRYCVLLSCSNIPSVHAQMFWLFDT